MSYSPSLTYFLDRLSGFSTNVFRLEAQNQDSASANKILRFTLPSNALLNMRSFALHFSATTAGGGARLPPKIDTLVDRVEVSCGGVQLSAGANFYNVLRHAKDALEGDKCSAILGHPEMVRQSSYVDNSSITGTNAEVYSDSNKSTQFCIDHWEGFLGSCEPKILDSSLVPDLVVSIFLADNNVLSSVAGIDLSGNPGNVSMTNDGAGNATYSLANIHATIECIGLGGATYNNMVAGMIASAGFLEIPFKQYFSFQDTTANTMRFSVATQSLDRIWVAPRHATFGAQGGAVVVAGHKEAGAFTAAAAAGSPTQDIGAPAFDIGGVMDYNSEKYLTKFVDFPEVPSSTKAHYQFQLNGAYYPQFRATFEEMSQISKQSVNYSGKKPSYSLHTAKTNYAVQCIRLNMPESEYGRLISGLDTRSVSLNGYYNMDNVSSARTLNLFAECSSTLRIGSGKMLEVVQ